MRLYRTSLLLLGALAIMLVPGVARAGKVTLDLGDSQGVTSVGAFNRWDQDGNARKKVNPKAKIESPEVDALAKHTGAGKWLFEDLGPGRYDFVVMAPGKVRIEGFHYPPVLEFDPFFGPDATTDEETREWITDDIKKSRHYENKVVPLYMGGDKKVVRVLVMLVRDQPTSYESEMPGAATIRHEVWQYTWQYGGWMKEKRTRVLDRSILPRDQLRGWTWLWEPKLGGIEVTKAPLTIEYELPAGGERAKLKGLLPY